MGKSSKLDVDAERRALAADTAEIAELREKQAEVARRRRGRMLRLNRNSDEPVTFKQLAADARVSEALVIREMAKAREEAEKPKPRRRAS